MGVTYQRRGAGRRRTYITACVLCVLCAVLALSGCNGYGRRSGVFDCLTGARSVDMTLTCGGFSSAFRIERSAELLKVEFTYPEELEGFSLCSQNGKLTVNYGELSTDAPQALSVIPDMLTEMFSLDEDAVTGVETRTESGETVTAVLTQSITVTLSSEGVPLRLEGVACGRSFKAEINGIQSDMRQN